VGDEVEHPVTDDEQGDHRCGARIAGPALVQITEHRAPNDEREKAVGDGIIVEPQREEGVRPWNDASMFPTQ
jgi:hypothetical protein